MSPTVYDFSARRLNGEEQCLGEYRGKVLLIVNTASKCGLTPQYEGLQQLYDQYRDRGLVVLGFPCNQFAGQEPGTEEEIAGFCQVNYGVTFPMFAKIEVNGDGAHPLYQWLKSERPGLLSSEAIKWNFTKFLVDAAGQPVKRYAPQTKPEEIKPDIEALLPAAPAKP
ncbi:MAG: glutathione peroxidase [Candidatus Latescibacterota bacterium]